MAFIQLTDLHFVPGDDLLYGTSPKARLAPVIERVNAEHADADFILVTGDLAHWGEEAAYETLREALAPCRVPVHLMMGNHDSRAPFARVFPDAPVIEGGFHQAALESDGARLLCLDSLHDVPGDHAGRLCDTRLRWLDAEIARTPADQRIILAAHHPFFEIGMPNMDDITLRDSAALWEVLRRRKPDLFLFGHVHRPISGVYRGVPFHTQHALNHQVALAFDRRPVLMFTAASPDLAVVRAIPDGFGVFTQSVGGEGPDYPAHPG